jgi:predicted RNA polymerase sigma factor
MPFTDGTKIEIRRVTAIDEMPQEALAEALVSWPRSGTWLLTTARLAG